MDSTTRRRLTALPLLLVVTLALAGCSGSAEPQSSSADREAAGGSGAAYDVATVEGQGAPDAGAPVEEAADLSGFERSVISTGMVSLLDADVAQARFDVQKIVDARGGEVAEEKTQTDEDGDVSRSRLVVRIPVAQFDETMEELETVARLESSSRTSEDVTTEVIDTEVRIRAQAKSLARVETLLARATSLRDIIAIEAELTRRQAELDSLKARQAYLADQTSLSTITVFVAEPPKESRPDEDESGFLAGLGSGWDGLRAFLVGAATVVGAVLPFAGLLVVLGVPLWLVGRSRWAARLLRRGGSGRTPSAA